MHACKMISRMHFIIPFKHEDGLQTFTNIDKSKWWEWSSEVDVVLWKINMNYLFDILVISSSFSRPFHNKYTDKQL